MSVRTTVATAATVALIPALVACGSNDKKTNSTSPVNTPSIASTPVGASATADGLNKMVALAKQVSAADGAAGKTLASGFEPLWKPIEDGIKAKDPNTYTSIEDAMAGLESGDKVKAAKAAGDLEAAVTTYLAK